MGADADQVGAELRTALAERLPAHDWTTEVYLGRTPVDVVGAGEPRVLVELEWRRADTSNNTVKLFRHLIDGASEGDGDVVLVQVFTRYYDLESGGASSKREHAEFVGERIAQTFDSVTYEPATIDIDPPKRGGEIAGDWRDAVDATADRIAAACLS